MARLTIRRSELNSQDLPLMLLLAENASEYAGDIIGGGGKPGTSYETKKTWKTKVNEGETWNYDYHWETDSD